MGTFSDKANRTEKNTFMFMLSVRHSVVKKKESRIIYLSKCAKSVLLFGIWQGQDSFRHGAERTRHLIL